MVLMHAIQARFLIDVTGADEWLLKLEAQMDELKHEPQLERVTHGPRVSYGVGLRFDLIYPSQLDFLELQP